jgi:hypothetical protein
MLAAKTVGLKKFFMISVLDGLMGNPSGEWLLGKGRYRWGGVGRKGIRVNVEGFVARHDLRRLERRWGGVGDPRFIIPAKRLILCARGRRLIRACFADLRRPHGVNDQHGHAPHWPASAADVPRVSSEPMPSPVASRVNRVRFRVGQAEAALREVVELLRDAAVVPGYDGPAIEVVERLAEVIAEVRGQVR